MPKSVMRLPMFLPGSNRNWDQIEAIATIGDDGSILVKLADPAKAEDLVDMARKNILLQMSFDYRMSAEMVDSINARHQDAFANILTEFIQNEDNYARLQGTYLTLDGHLTVSEDTKDELVELFPGILE